MIGVRRARGFTLLEMLVVVALFSLLAVAGHASLHTVLEARARVAHELDRLQRLQWAFMLFERDLGQAAPRAVRDRHGGSRSALIGAIDGGTLRLELTRAGWRNPAGAPRSTLQRVVYVLDDRALRRIAYTVLDGASQRAARERVLLDDVHGATVRFLDAERRWHMQWPPQAAAVAHAPLLAVELVLQIPDWGRLRRLFPVPAGSGA